MIPGISTGIAAMIVKNKFNQEERDNALTAFISGLFGIAEIALPYAIRDPIRTIGDNVIGAAISGAMMMYFNVSTSGVSGIYGFPMANNISTFLLSISIGAIISLVIQIVWKKPIDHYKEREVKVID